MQCMKCGREIQQGQVFCEACLEEMAKYSVSPGTVVQLPRRPSAPPVKKPPQRRKPTPEEQVKKLRRRSRLLTVLLLLALVALFFLGRYVVQEGFQQQTGFQPGQNYSSVNSTTAPTETDGAD